MTKEQEQEQEVIRIAGPDYEQTDIPALWREDQEMREEKGREIEDIN